MEQHPSLDTHGHLDPFLPPQDLEGSGYVLAMSLSLQEADKSIVRSDKYIAWGVGCHPRRLTAQSNFNISRFRDLLVNTAIVGEVGLDTGSHFPIEKQLKIFRQVLEAVQESPRLVSIHSYRATGLVLDELRRTPIDVPVLHWWTGNAAETTEAVELGCYFSIHSAVARHSKFRTWVPKERILLESDHGYRDPPAAIPCRVEWAAHLVAQQLGMDVKEIRILVWNNFRTIINKTGTMNLLPAAFISTCSDID